MYSECTLNEKQLKAATSNATLAHRPPTLIIAGAGTGKTNTLAHKTAQLLLNGIAPERILLMTFARRASAELTSRANSIVNKVLSAKKQSHSDVKLPWCGTFHSIASRLLREHAQSIGIESDFTVVDRSDAADIIDMLRHQLDYSATEQRFPKKRTCLDIYSRCVNGQKPIEEVLEQSFPHCQNWHSELTKLFAAYAQTKVDQASLDYDDLLLYCYHMAKVPDIAALVREQFDFILVDEYQDTNLLQSGILQGFFPDGNGLTVVGDDAQSIYSFRSATVDNILNFPEQFSQPADVISLNVNYRSHQGILDLSNALLAEGEEGFKIPLISHKTLTQKQPDNEENQKVLTQIKRPMLVSVEDDAKQAEYICEQILAARERNVPLKKQAVLFRTSYHSDRLELELTRRDIPYVKYGGLKFLEASHVKDLLCLLRWADNPKHRISAFRILKMLPGIGPKSAEKVCDFLELHHFDMTSLQNYTVPLAAQSYWQNLAPLLANVNGEQIPWVEQVQVVANLYQQLLEEHYDDHFARWGDIEQLIAISQQYPNRERFLTELSLDPPQASGDLAGKAHIDDDFLILSTVHSAKGQEWQNVFILNVADGNFPNEYAVGNNKAMAEERRLLNVAITRAKDELHLIQPLKYWVPEQQKFGDKHVYGGKSRFLTDSLMKQVEKAFYPCPEKAEIKRQEAKAAITDIRKSILATWQ